MRLAVIGFLSTFSSLLMLLFQSHFHLELSTTLHLQLHRHRPTDLPLPLHLHFDSHFVTATSFNPETPATFTLIPQIPTLDDIQINANSIQIHLHTNQPAQFYYQINSSSINADEKTPNPSQNTPTGDTTSTDTKKVKIHLLQSNQTQSIESHQFINTAVAQNQSVVFGEVGSSGEFGGMALIPFLHFSTSYSLLIAVRPIDFNSTSPSEDAIWLRIWFTTLSPFTLASTSTVVGYPESPPLPLAVFPPALSIHPSNHNSSSIDLVVTSNCNRTLDGFLLYAFIPSSRMQFESKSNFDNATQFINWLNASNSSPFINEISIGLVEVNNLKMKQKVLWTESGLQPATLYSIYSLPINSITWMGLGEVKLFSSHHASDESLIFVNGTIDFSSLIFSDELTLISTYSTSLNSSFSFASSSITSITSNSFTLNITYSYPSSFASPSLSLLYLVLSSPLSFLSPPSDYVEFMRWLVISSGGNWIIEVMEEEANEKEELREVE